MLLLAAALFAALFALEGANATPGQPASTEGRPNFVVIQTDDQTMSELYAAYRSPGGGKVRAMPNTLRLIAGKGVTFNRYYVSYSLCCPSRVTMLTGRYAHNHDVRGNSPPNGGYTGFASRSAFTHNLAPWLDDAGYRTIHIGKFLNAYGDAPYDNGRTVPPGWDVWHTVLRPDTKHLFYGYTLNDNGSIHGPLGGNQGGSREYRRRDDPGCSRGLAGGRPCMYETDLFNRMATAAIGSTPHDTPFYLQMDYTAPHGDFRKPAGPEPAARHYDTFRGAPLPHNRAQGFDEANNSDKPGFIGEIPHFNRAEIRNSQIFYQKSLESLRSLDQGVKMIVHKLAAEHRLGNTYIIFVSDNGAFFGEHRLNGGKFLAYEPSTHLPFLMRGPGIRPHSHSGELVANTDIAPTVLDLAGVKPDAPLDGRSVVPYAQDPTLRSNRPILFESFIEGSGPSGPQNNRSGIRVRPLSDSLTPSAHRRRNQTPRKNYFGIRLGRYKYIEWRGGNKELYDLVADPYELKNQVENPRLSSVISFLHGELVRLQTCAGASCREDAGAIPPD